MAQKYDNSGALFKKAKDAAHPKWPDYDGSITVEGKDYWISAWIKEGNNGKFMSLSVKPKEKQAQSRQARVSDDDLPF